MKLFVLLISVEIYFYLCLLYLNQVKIMIFTLAKWTWC